MYSLTDWKALRESVGRVGFDDEPWDDLTAECMAARSLFESAEGLSPRETIRALFSPNCLPGRVHCAGPWGDSTTHKRLRFDNGWRPIGSSADEDQVWGDHGQRKSVPLDARRVGGIGLDGGGLRWRW